MPWSREAEGQRRFDTLAFPIADDDALIDFQDALDLINLAEMPPEDEPQPTDAEQRKVVAWLTAAIAKHQAEPTAPVAKPYCEDSIVAST